MDIINDIIYGFEGFLDIIILPVRVLLYFFIAMLIVFAIYSVSKGFKFLSILLVSAAIYLAKMVSDFIIRRD